MLTRRETPLRLAAVWLSALSVGACVPSVDHPASDSTDVKEKEPRGLILRLSAEPEQPRDEVTVELTVINRTGRPLGWDSEFSAGVRIFVRGLRDDQDVLRTRETVLPPRWGRDRFIVLRRGQALTKQFILTEPMRWLSGGLGSGGPDRTAVHFGYENGHSYSIPEDWENIAVSAHYYIVPIQSHVAFHKVFGFGPDDVDMFQPEETVTSNRVHIRMR